MQFSGDKVESFPVRDPNNSPRLLPDREVDSNRILRDRDGGLWIGAIERGLIHIHNGRTDEFTKADGLAGDVILAMYEDREGDIWVSSTGGLDRFRELPVSTVSVKQGLSSDASQSVLAATDGSIWVGAHDGLTRFKHGQATILRKGSGLPDSATGSLFQDDRGRIWATLQGHGLGYFQADRFVGVLDLPSEGVHSITGDNAGNLWLSTDQNFLHVLNGHLVEKISWSEMGRVPSASVLLNDPERSGLWMGFWAGGGLLFFIDGHPRATYTVADGL
jgi:ligand-binding sensor domain-containing protein